MVSNLKETWAYYNSQVLNEAKTYSQLKMTRIADQMNTYIKEFNKLMNKSLGVFINMSTKLISLGLGE